MTWATSTCNVMTNLYFLPNGNAQICWLQREIEIFIRHQPKLAWFFPLWEEHGSNFNTKLPGWLVFFALVYFNFLFCTSVESFVENTFCTLKNPFSPSFLSKIKIKISTWLQHPSSFSNLVVSKFKFLSFENL